MATKLSSALHRLISTEEADAVLLSRYAEDADEQAFRALVSRHGSMVLAVCRRVLGNAADAEDAYQATFLVLVRKAGGVRDPHGLANWLFGVAHNVALKARQARTRRQRREAAVVPRTPAEVSCDFGELLHTELAKLPAANRTAVLLCDLEGRTIAEAAKQLGIPAGTVASRLARGRTALAKRLAKHGLSVSGGLLGAMLGESARAAALPPVVPDTAIPAPIHTLAEEVMRTMTATPKATKLVAILVAVAMCGAALLVPGAASEPRPARTNAPVPKEKKAAAPPIVGAWVPVDSGGPLAPGQLVITFQAGGKVKYEQGKQVEFGWYKLGEKNPAEIDYATPRRANPENKAPPFLGLYTVEDDVLTMYLSEKARPVAFAALDGSGILKTSYRRAKQIEDGKPGASREQRKNAPIPKETKPDTRKLLADAAKSAARIRDRHDRAGTLLFVATEQAACGHREDATATYGDAVKAATEIADIPSGDGMLMLIAGSQARSGDLKGAGKTIEALRDPSVANREHAARVVARHQALGGEIEAAIKASEKFPRVWKDQIHGIAARNRIDQGKFDDARREIDKIVDDDSSKASLLAALAVALHKAKKAADAAKTADEALKAARLTRYSEESTRLAVELVKMSVALGRVEEARKLAKDNEQLPESARLVVAVAEGQAATGDSAGALETLKGIVESNRRHPPEVMAWAAVIYLQAGDTKSALELAKGVNDPFFRALCRLRLARDFAGLGKTTEAKAVIELTTKELEQLDQQRLQIQVTLGETWAAIGQPEEALKHLPEESEPTFRARYLTATVRGIRESDTGPKK